jgi:hypothetical protein
MRRVTFWAVVASPLLVMGAAFLIAEILELFGANCVTYGNNPMGFDNETVCNELGEVRVLLGLLALVLVVVLTPVAFVIGAAGAWRALTRRGR